MRYLISMLLIIALFACKKEDPCLDRCGPTQICVEGQCTCRESAFEMDGFFCAQKQTGYYYGRLDCDCGDGLGIALDVPTGNTYECAIRFAQGSSGVSYQKLDENTYRFIVSRPCKDDDRTFPWYSVWLEITATKSGTRELEVRARFLSDWTPHAEVLSECTAIFELHGD